MRLVLFGMPDAGKSSLLGALGQAAQTQEHLLNGHLSDVGRGLAEMQRRLYDEGPRNTLEEVLPFATVFEPFSAGAGGRMEAVIIDCDGRVANDLLARRRELSLRGGGELGRAILQADAVIFAVDVAASDAQIEADFTECARFLRLLEERRGLRAEVGGLPVFLVLTKCDLLARPGDDLAAWVEKVEERKRVVGKRFQAFLDRNKRGPAPAFGSVQLHVWATAVKRPELADSPVKPREPYGVAELFRQCFALAREHRGRRGSSGRRLVLVLLVALVALGAFAALPAYIVLSRPNEKVSDLETQVAQFRSRDEELAETAPAARYRQIQQNIDRLYSFRRNKSFGELPDELKEYVNARSKDLEEYQAFADLVDALPDPRGARSEAELKEVRQKIDSLVPVLEKHPDWKSSDADRRLTERQEDAVAIERALLDVRTRYEKVVKDGRQVLKDSEKPNLPTRARKALDAARGLPEPKTDAVRPLPGTERVTYATVFGFQSVKDLLREWESVRKELELPASLLKP